MLASLDSSLSLLAHAGGVRCTKGMWNRERIREKVLESADKYGFSNPQQITQLLFSCGKSEEREVFFGLYSFFYDPALQENFETRQELAGKLLYEINPSCPLELDGIVYAIPKYWDVSVEEIPWYLCRHFGKSTVTKFLEELLPDVADNDMKNSFETMLFWAKRYSANVT